MSLIKKATYLLKKNPGYLPFLAFGFLRKQPIFNFLKKSGLSPFPELVTILITKRCNFFCPGCSSSSPKYTKSFLRKKQPELSTAEIKKLIDQIAFFKPFIYFNGGEPTLRQDLLELVSYVKKKGLVCSFTTNGSLLTPDFAKKLMITKIDFLSVSIDGPQRFHDQARGFPGAFNRASAGIKELVKQKKKNSLDYPHIRLASIIFPEKTKNAEFIVSLANKLGIDELAFGLLMFYPKKIIKEQKDFVKKHRTGGLEPIGLAIKNREKIDFSSQKYQKFLEFIKAKAQMPVYFAYQGGQLDDYFDPRKYPSQKSPCLTPWSGLVVQPDGSLEICQGFKFGSLKKGSLLSQWNNQKIRRFRKLRAKMPFPACFRCNEGQQLIFD
jgi:MoaA/NifB/PqqE/SkfB family radical SAM enzyme